MNDQVRLEWATQTRAEYISAARTAELQHWLLAVGASPYAVLRCQKVVADEVRHAELSHEIYLLAGGTDAPLAIPEEEVWLVHDKGAPTLFRALSATAQVFGAGESAAQDIFEALLEHSREPRVVQVLDSLVRDERFHRTFGWDCLDELLEIAGEPGRAWLRERTPAYVDWLATTYDWAPREVSPEEQAWGVMPHARYREISARCIRDVIVPRFADRRLLPEGYTWSP